MGNKELQELKVFLICFTIPFVYQYINVQSTADCKWYRNIEIPTKLLIIMVLFWITKAIVTSPKISWTALWHSAKCKIIGYERLKGCLAIVRETVGWLNNICSVIVSYPIDNMIKTIGKMFQSATVCFREKRSTEFWTLLHPDSPGACPRASWIGGAKADTVGPLGTVVWQKRQTERKRGSYSQLVLKNNNKNWDTFILESSYNNIFPLFSGTKCKSAPLSMKSHSPLSYLLVTLPAWPWFLLQADFMGIQILMLREV